MFQSTSLPKRSIRMARMARMARTTALLSALLTALPALFAPSAARAADDRQPNRLGQLLYGWVAGRVLDEIYDTVTGAPDVSEMKRQLDSFAQANREFANDIAQLKSQLRDRMTRQELALILADQLARVDAELAAMAARIQKTCNSIPRS
jgi:hypothetical protein